MIDPFYECSESVRDEIDIAYKRRQTPNGLSHEERVAKIIKGELPLTCGEDIKPVPKDPYPKPQCDISILKKGSRFVRKMAQQAGWI